MKNQVISVKPEYDGKSVVAALGHNKRTLEVETFILHKDWSQQKCIKAIQAGVDPSHFEEAEEGAIAAFVRETSDFRKAMGRDTVRTKLVPLYGVPETKSTMSRNEIIGAIAIKAENLALALDIVNAKNVKAVEKLDFKTAGSALGISKPTAQKVFDFVNDSK